MKRIFLTLIAACGLLCGPVMAAEATEYQNTPIQAQIRYAAEPIEEETTTETPIEETTTPEEPTTPDTDTGTNVELGDSELGDLIEDLVNELSKEDINLKTVGTIVLSILGVFGSAIIGLLIGIVRLKITNINKDEVYRKIEEKYQAKFDEYQKAVQSQLSALENKVCKKIDETELQRQREAEAQSLKLKESVETAKKNLDLNKVLDEE